LPCVTPPRLGRVDTESPQQGTRRAEGRDTGARLATFRAWGDQNVRFVHKEERIMPGTIDSAVERKRDEEPATRAEKREKLESDKDRPKEAQRKLPHESPRETPKTD
jgi:hypothetical protein